MVAAVQREARTAARDGLAMEYEPLYEEIEPEHLCHDCPIADEEHVAIQGLVDELYRKLKY